MPSQTIPVTGLNVPQLSDNQVAFINADAWNSYWAQLTFSVTIPGNLALSQASTVAYIDPGVTPTNYVQLMMDPLGNGNFVPVPIPSKASFDELKTQIETLNTNYKQLKAAMVLANLISNA